MTPSDKVEFAKILNRLAAMKPGTNNLTEPAMEGWWEAMTAGNWSLDEFRQAANHLALSVEFMPNPWNFEQLRKAGRPTAGEAFQKARKASGSCVHLGRYTENGTCGDAFIDRVVREIGGYKVIAQASIESLHFIEKSFSEHYEALQDAEAVRQALPQVTRHARLTEAGKVAEAIQREIGESRLPLTKAELRVVSEEETKRR
jgi:hypothetical protein